MVKDDDNWLRVYVNQTGMFTLYHCLNGTVFYPCSLSTHIEKAFLNRLLTAELIITSSKCILDLYWENKRIGRNVITENIPTYLLNSTVELSIGGGTSLVGFGGKIDLSSYKIYMDEKLIYQPCLKIPYIEAKNGTKIVDKLYKNRINDLYNQNGCSPYFMIRENMNAYDEYIVGEVNIQNDLLYQSNEGGLAINFTTDTYQNLTFNFRCYIGADAPANTIDINTIIYGHLLGQPDNMNKMSPQIELFRDRIWIGLSSDANTWYGDGDGDSIAHGIHFPLSPILSTETWYNFKVELTPTSVSCYIDEELIGTKEINIITLFEVCALLGNDQFSTGFNQIIDINAFEIYKDGKLAFTFRDKIDTHTPYYTLPQGNIYGSQIIEANRSKIAGFGMPSDRYIDLTLGATGSTYTAPANGYYILQKRVAGTTTEYVTLRILSNNFWQEENSSVVGNNLSLFLPVLKGQTVRIGYNASGNTEQFKFIYAQGSEQELNS